MQILVHLEGGVPYLHPVLALLGVFIGSWLPAILRTIQAISRPLNAILRRM